MRVEGIYDWNFCPWCAAELVAVGDDELRCRLGHVIHPSRWKRGAVCENGHVVAVFDDD